MELPSEKLIACLPLYGVWSLSKQSAPVISEFRYFAMWQDSSENEKITVMAHGVSPYKALRALVEKIPVPSVEEITGGA